MEPTFSNELLHEQSAYLLQHAHNPVHWYTWSEKALQLAQQQNKIILLSIGYAACHWCHVMERESFEDEAVAALMNEHFINIKVDREERPDLDHLYMEAVQLLCGSGGWPLNVFLTPDGRPFYGGTYFPPQPLHHRMSWTQLLHSIIKIWNENRDQVYEQSSNLLNHMKMNAEIVTAFNKKENNQLTGEFDEAYCRQVAVEILKKADLQLGGFGRAPKFPQFTALQYLLGFGYFYQQDAALQHAKLSLFALMRGGIYDHLAGGISRYSTDDEWLVPHFEKMLSDNALFVMVLCDAYSIFQEPSMRDCIIHTLNFCVTELKNTEGTFYASIDADSEQEEGKFYVWDKKEIEEILGEEAPLFCECYNISDEGNWEGKNILSIRKPWKAIADKNGIEISVLHAKIKKALAALLQKRNQRIKPIVDDKVNFSWNALMVTAFAKAAAVLEMNVYQEEAMRLYQNLKATFLNNSDSHYHSYCKGILKQQAFLDDYAFFIQGAIHLYELSGDENYLEDAYAYTQYVRTNFKQENTGFYYFTSIQQQDVILRKVESFEGATPSGSCVMLENCHYLSVIFDEKDWGAEVAQTISAMKELIGKFPHSLGSYAMAALKRVKGIHEIVVTGYAIQEIVTQINTLYWPNKIFLHSSTPKKYHLLKESNYTKPFTIQLCKDFSCNDKIVDVEDLKQHI